MSTCDDVVPEGRRRFAGDLADSAAQVLFFRSGEKAYEAVR